MWPFMSQPIALVISPEMCTQITQTDPQPRHPTFKWAQIPLTGGYDLLSMEPAIHKIWRSRLNPGFSATNLATHMPALLEEVAVFVDGLKSMAGEQGNWGNMFTFYDRAIALTFDVIMRIATGQRIHEQTEGPSSILVSLRTLISCCKIKTLQSTIERMTPAFKRTVAANSKTIRAVLYPAIAASVESQTALSTQKTVVDLAVKHVRENKEHLNPKFIDQVIGNLKIFLFAGHDTTAQTLCWVFYEVAKRPDVLAKLRTEYQEILGEETARTAFLHAPHKLNQLRYTSAVIKEALRLHTPAGSLRLSRPDFSLTQDGVRYPVSNMILHTLPSGSHILPSLWQQPEDFVPDRWLVSEGHPLHPVKNAYRPFELGTTRCIGEELAMMEMKLALTVGFQELDFDFNYAMWDGIHERAEGESRLVRGERAYRSGLGMGQIKDSLPSRVKIR